MKKDNSFLRRFFRRYSAMPQPIQPPESPLLDAFERLYDPTSGFWHIPTWLTTKFSADLVDDWRNRYELWPSAVEREVGHFLTALVSMLRPSRVLETGTNTGYSTYCIAKALLQLGGDRQVFTLDIAPAEHLFKDTEVEPFITALVANSLEVDFRLLQKGNVTGFDLVFLDSDHQYETVIGELNRFGPLLAVGGVLLIHDSMFFDSIALAVRQLMKHSAFEVLTLPTPRFVERRTVGLTIARKVSEVERDFLLVDPALKEIEMNTPGRTLSDPSLLSRE